MIGHRTALDGYANRIGRWLTRSSLWLHACVAFASAVVLLGPHSIAEDREDVTLQAMTELGLADVAIEYIRGRRELLSTEPDEFAFWTMRLMEAQAQAALRGSDETLWQAAEKTLAEFMDSRDAVNPADARRLPWLQWQAARCNLLRTQQALATHLAAPGNIAAQENALVLIRLMEKQVGQLKSDIAERLPLAAREVRRDGKQAPANELHELQVDATLLLCEALLIRGRLYPEGSADRSAAANEVARLAEEAFSRTEPSWPAREQILIARAAAWLDLGRTDEALAELQRLLRTAQQTGTRTRAAALAIRYLCSRGLASRAAGLLTMLPAAGPERAIAEIQIAIADLPADSGTGTAEQRERQLQRIVNAAREIGSRHGSYWQNRAEALLVEAGRSNGSSSNNSSLELVAVEVRQLLAAGNTAGAIERLLQARDNEVAAERGANALRLAAQAAALLIREQQWNAATQAVEQTARRFTSEPTASETHRLGILAKQNELQSALDSSPTPGNVPELDALRGTYESMLRTQISTWPDSAASDLPLDWLTLWLQGQGRSAELPGVLLSRATAAQTPEAVQNSLWKWLEALCITASRYPPLDSADSRALKTGTGTGDGPTDLNASIRELEYALRQSELSSQSTLAELTLLAAEALVLKADGAAQASRVPTSMVQALRELPDRWQQLQIAVDLSITAAAHDRSATQSLAMQWKPMQLSLPLRNRFAIIACRAIDTLPLRQHRDWAKLLKLEEKWIEELQQSPSAELQAVGAKLAGLDGQVTQALTKLTELYEAERRSPIIGLYLASSLAESGANRIPDAQMILRRVIAATEPRTELHLAARWQYVRNLLATEQRDEATKMIGLLQATQLGNRPTWKRRFESLQQSP